MRGRLLAVLALAALAGLTVAPTASADSRIGDRGFGCVLVTHLTPAEEIRTDAIDPVESVARGVAVLRVRENGEIRFTVVIVNPARETFVAGHIHQAPFGVNGPVVVPLFSGMDNRFVFHQSDEVMASSPALAQAICDNPAGFYVNYHTTQDPQGAVRGQLD
jgi:CHRD domain